MELAQHRDPRETRRLLVAASTAPWRSNLLQSLLDHSQVLEYRTSRLSRVDARCGLEGFEQLPPKLSHILKSLPVLRAHIGGNERFKTRWQEKLQAKLLNQVVS
jgi:hypothetical protein